MNGEGNRGYESNCLDHSGSLVGLVGSEALSYPRLE